MTSSVHVNEPTSHNRRNISGSLWEFFEIYSAIGLVYSLTAPFLTIQRYFDTSSLSFGEAISVPGILALETPVWLEHARSQVRGGAQAVVLGFHLFPSTKMTLRHLII